MSSTNQNPDQKCVCVCDCSNTASLWQWIVGDLKNILCCGGQPLFVSSDAPPHQIENAKKAEKDELCCTFTLKCCFILAIPLVGVGSTLVALPVDGYNSIKKSIKKNGFFNCCYNSPERQSMLNAEAKDGAPAPTNASYVNPVAARP